MEGGFREIFFSCIAKEKNIFLDPELAFTTSRNVINHMAIQYILQEQDGRRYNNPCDGRSPESRK